MFIDNELIEVEVKIVELEKFVFVVVDGMENGYF